MKCFCALQLNWRSLVLVKKMCFIKLCTVQWNVQYYCLRVDGVGIVELGGNRINIPNCATRASKLWPLARLLDCGTSSPKAPSSWESMATQGSAISSDWLSHAPLPHSYTPHCATPLSYPVLTTHPLYLASTTPLQHPPRPTSSPLYPTPTNRRSEKRWVMNTMPWLCRAGTHQWRDGWRVWVEQVTGEWERRCSLFNGYTSYWRSLYFQLIFYYLMTVSIYSLF